MAADKIAQREYDWEANYVEPCIPPVRLSREECEEYVMKAVAISGVVAPTLSFPKTRNRCTFYPKRWHVEISGWGRTPVTILHEMAHLAALPAAIAGENPHGPAFVRQAIEFYHRIIGIDQAYLFKTAASIGLEIGDTLYRHRQPKRPELDFSHIDI
jgi:hypothetical protein